MTTATGVMAPFKAHIEIPAGDHARLGADVTIPGDAAGVVVLAPGSGSSRRSPRNCYVACELNSVRLATVVAGLLIPREEDSDQTTRSPRFDIPLLTQRLIAVIDWARRYPPFDPMPMGLFGASTGAAAALDAAAARPDVVKAVVSRGGRPDLASQLGRVKAPTLLIVGGEDTGVIELNADALRHLQCPKRLDIVRGATHLFEEQGALEHVATLAATWFREHLGIQPHA